MDTATMRSFTLLLPNKGLKHRKRNWHADTISTSCLQ
jgi:hypothetical protein